MSYLYVCHSVVVEITACCKAFATNWTFWGLEKNILSLEILDFGGFMSFWAYRVVSRLDFEEIMEEKQN
jgi:hypothetical protein